MENDFNSIRWVIEQLNSPDLVQDWIVRIVSHVVCHNGRISSSLECKHSSFEQNPVLSRDELLRIRNFASRFAVPSRRLVKQSPSNGLFDFIDC